MATDDMRASVPMKSEPPDGLSSQKRAHDALDQDNDQVDSPNTTPQKRLKVSNNSQPDPIKDSAMGEGHDDLKASTPKSAEDREQNAVSGSPHPVKESGAAPSMNWNVGTKAKIRTSLGGISRKASVQEAGKQEKAKPQSKTQSREIRKTRRRLDVLTEKLSTIEHVNSKFRKIQKRIYEAEVDCNYCLFYPINREYQSLFPQGKDEASELEDEDENSGKGRGRYRGLKPPLWRLVERCMKVGILEDLKSGNVDNNSLTDDVGPSVPQTDSEPTIPPQKATQQDLIGSETATHVGMVKVFASGKMIATVDSTTSQTRASDIYKAIEKANVSPVENRVFTVKISPEPQNEAEGQNPELHLDPATFHVQETRYVQESDDRPDSGQDQDSESDDGVLINLQTSEQESGEISETNSKAPSNHEENDMMVDDSCDRNDGDGKEEDHGDAMMDYSRSDAVAKDLRGTAPRPHSTITQRNQPLTLAQLNSEDLKAQLRYFHTTKRPIEVDRNTLVRCLVCAQENHMADVCVKLTCTICGSYGDHFSLDCPRKKRCRKCRALGHVERDCPYKLKHLAPEEIICDLCQQSGHYEGDCELLWRTSGRPWESELMNKLIRLSCYECGKIGHLGNDCPSRRPGKASGTSTWSLHYNGQFTIKSKGEVTIKGRAQQQNPIVISDSDDDQDNFYRPRVHQPARKGQIRIMTGANQNPHPRQHDTYTPGGQSFRNNTKTNSRGGGYWDSPRDNDYRNDQRQDGFRFRDQRSLSPRRSEPFPGRGNRNSYELPQRPEDRPALGSGGNQGRARDRRGGGHRHVHHHPMPSAAQKAWSKHRT